MDIKINSASPKPSYPRIKKTDDSLTVLFVARGHGVVLNCESGSYRAGHLDSGWAEELFTDCSDVVTLQND